MKIRAGMPRLGHLPFRMAGGTKAPRSMITLGARVRSVRAAWIQLQKVLSSTEARQSLTSDWRLMALIATGWGIATLAIVVAGLMWWYGARLSDQATMAKVTMPAILTSADANDAQNADVARALAQACPDLDVKPATRGVAIKAHDNGSPQYFAWRECLLQVPSLRPNWRFRFLEMSLGEDTKQPPSAVIDGAIITIGQ